MDLANSGDTLSGACGVMLVCDDRPEYGGEAQRARDAAANALRNENVKLAAERDARERAKERGSDLGAVVRFEMVDGLIASQVDREIHRGRRAGDIGHRTVAFYLADCADRGLYQEYGHASVIPYAMKRHHISRRSARNLIVAGRALRELRKIDDAFRRGDLSWSKVRAIAKVADPKTEDEWLAFALTHVLDDVEREAGLAKKGGRPREDRKGTPSVKFDVRLRVSTLIHEQYLLARQKLGADLGHDATDEEVAGALLDAYLRRGGEGASVDSLFRVVVDWNPAGGTASIRSEGGPTPVDDATAAAICCDAGVLGADGQRVAGHAPPIHDALRRRILARDGHRCRICGSRIQLHVHHIVWREKHGSNAQANLMASCTRCHALVHGGFLVVEGNAPYALVFKDRKGDQLTDPARLAEGDRTGLEITTAGGPAGPPDSGFAAAKPGVSWATLPSVIDPLWLTCHRHLISWKPDQTVLRIEAGQPLEAEAEEVGPSAAGPANPARPTTFDDVVGQDGAVASLRAAAAAAKNTGRMPPPALLAGRSGLGKTTLARALAKELGSRLKVIDSATLDNPLTLLGHLMGARERDVLFFDEMHALPQKLGEALYQALEDGVIDLPFSDGLRTKTVRFVLPKVTFIGATTNPEKMPRPLMTRFVNQEELEPYGVDDLAEIVRRAGAREGFEVTSEAAAIIARASAATARTAIGLFTRARDVVVVKRGAAIITADDARAALRLARTDEDGLGPVHRRILGILAKHGRPLAVRRLADWAGISVGAFRSFYEAALMLSGAIVPTPRGIAIGRTGLQALRSP